MRATAAGPSGPNRPNGAAGGNGGNGANRGPATGVQVTGEDRRPTGTRVT